jgi:hypothetical protein
MPARDCRSSVAITGRRGHCRRAKIALRWRLAGYIVLFADPRRGAGRTCTCGVEARQRSLRRGRSGIEPSGGFSACSVSYPQRMLVASRVLKRTPPSFHDAHNTTSTLSSRAGRRRCPRVAVYTVAPLSFCFIAWPQRPRRGAVLPSLGRAPSPPLLFAATRLSRIGRLPPPTTAQRLHHHEQKHDQSW